MNLVQDSASVIIPSQHHYVTAQLGLPEGLPVAKAVEAANKEMGFEDEGLLAAQVARLLDANIVKPQYCPTHLQLADWLTKPLVKHTFCRFRAQLMRPVSLSFTH